MNIVQTIIDEERETQHRGRQSIPVRRKQAWVKALARDFCPDEWPDLIQSLVTSESLSAREIGAVLLGDTKSDWNIFTYYVQKLATDNDWEVREWAVNPLVTWWGRDPHCTGELFSRWLTMGGRTRRAVINAALKLLIKGEWSCEQVVNVVDQVISDSDSYIIDSVRFLISDGLLRECPTLAVETLQRHLRRNYLPEAVVKNVLGVLKSSSAHQHKELLRPVLIEALSRLGKRDAGVVRRWLER